MHTYYSILIFITLNHNKCLAKTHTIHTYEAPLNCVLLLLRFGPRFPPMSGVYDKDLRKLAFDICKRMGVTQFVQEGVYCMVGGPNFESIAEARLLHKLGVDAVGELL